MNTRSVVTGVAAIGVVLALRSLAAPSGGEPVPAAAREPYVRTTRAAVESLKTNLKDFRFTLEYHGPDAARFHSLRLSVAPPSDQLPASWLSARITGDEAAILLGYLAGDGYLYRGATNRSKRLVRPEGPHYLLSVEGKDGDSYFEFVPAEPSSYRWHWMTRPPMVQQFDGLRSVLTGESAEAMDKLAAAVEKSQKPKEPRADPAGTG